MGEYFLLWLCSKIKFLTIQFGDSEERSKKSKSMMNVISAVELKRLFWLSVKKIWNPITLNFQGTDFENGWAPSALVMKLQTLSHWPSHRNVPVGFL